MKWITPCHTGQNCAIRNTLVISYWYYNLISILLFEGSLRLKIFIGNCRATTEKYVTEKYNKYTMRLKKAESNKIFK